MGMKDRTSMIFLVYSYRVRVVSQWHVPFICKPFLASLTDSAMQHPVRERLPVASIPQPPSLFVVVLDNAVTLRFVLLFILLLRLCSQHL